MELVGFSVEKPPHIIHRIESTPNLSLPSYHAWLPGELGKRLVMYFLLMKTGTIENMSEIQSIKQKLPNLKFQLKKLRVLGEDRDEEIYEITSCTKKQRYVKSSETPPWCLPKIGETCSHRLPNFPVVNLWKPLI